LSAEGHHSRGASDVQIRLAERTTIGKRRYLVDGNTGEETYEEQESQHHEVGEGGYSCELKLKMSRSWGTPSAWCGCSRAFPTRS